MNLRIRPVADRGQYRKQWNYHVLTRYLKTNARFHNRVLANQIMTHNLFYES